MRVGRETAAEPGAPRNASTASENVKYRQGGTLVETDRQRAATLTAAGRAAFPGFVLEELARVKSTQDVVRAAARHGAAAGFCCIAGEQSEGRGRQGRRWVAPPGSALLCSTLVRVDSGVVGGVPLAAELAVHDALRNVSGVNSRLKWPNDVMVAGRKLAGVLCEVEPRAPGRAVAVVVGVGVNLGSGSVPAGVDATSVEHSVGVAPPAATFLAALLGCLAASLSNLDTGGVAALRDRWMDRAWGLGQEVLVRGPAGDVDGVAESIDDDGALLVRHAGTLTRVLAADVHLVPRRPAP